MSKREIEVINQKTEMHEHKEAKLKEVVETDKRIKEREKKQQRRIVTDLETQISEEKRRSKVSEIEVKKLKVQL